MENIKGILNSGDVEGELSDVESDGSGELESGEEVSESSDEEPPPPPPPPPKRPIIRSNKKHNNIIRRIPHRDFLKQKRKSEALKAFHKFSKKMKLDTGLSIKTIAGGDIVELDELLSDSDESITKEESESSDGLSESEFTVDLEAALEPEGENESFIDPETGAITVPGQKPAPGAPVDVNNTEPSAGEESIDSAVTSDNKTLTISDIIEEGSEFDLDKNVDIEEILGANQFTIEKKKSFEEGGSSEPQETEEMKEPTKRTSGEIKTEHSETKEIKSEGSSETPSSAPATSEATKAEDEKNKNAINLRRNIREVMDEKNLDASTLTAQRQESERLARVQEQQRIIREVRRQIALGRQQGASLLKGTNLKNLNLPGTVLMKVPSGTEAKKIGTKPGQVDVLKIQLTKGNLTPSVSIAPVGAKPDIKIVKDQDKKEVVEIVDSSSSSSSSESPSSDSDDCIMLSDSEVPPSPEADEDPNNCGLHVNDTYNVPDEQGRVQINIGHPENEEDIFLAPQIARIIKPHQIGGVRFLFDNIIESVERFSTSTGFGCILAHSMGLGKTLQIVCFTDIFLRHTKSKTVLCIMPINTLQNWVAEFNMWLPTDPSTSPLSAQGEVRPRNFPIFVLNDNHKTLEARAKVIKEWSTQGGVLMIGYELYRLLSLKKNKKPRLRKKKNDPPEPEKTAHTKVTTDSKNSDDKDKEKDESKDSSDTADGTKKSVVNGGTDGEETKDGEKAKTDEKDEAKSDKAEKEEELDEEAKLLNEIFNALVKPGPDLVICDEGHRIKNSHSNISYALKQMRTKRRVVLTGYPLQNNLLEYWCMVDFVRPNYLGTKTEFSNMFERPIQNGQCIDSTPQDIRLMRYRAHVLHSLLLGFVQRRSHAVLQSTLPQKEEYVLLIKMTDLQRKLYDTFMNEVVRKKTVPNPLKAFAVCCKIWNHPDVLYYFLKQRSEMAAIIDYDLDIEDANPGVTAAALAAARRAVGNNPIIRKPGRGRGAPRKTDKIPLPNKPGNNGKPAASIPPNSSGSTDYNAYDPNKAGQTNRPNQYNFGGDVNQPHPYPYNYQQYPSQPNYYGQNNSYNPQYNNEYYSQQQPYNNYNQQYPPNATQPPPPQHYPQNSQYNQQGYWGPDNNYYHHNNYYPNSQPPYQPTPDAYGNVYDPYGQQSYQGYPNPARPYDANAPPPSGTYNQNVPPQHRPYDAGVPNQNGSYNSNVPPQPRPYDPNIPNPTVPYDANVPPRPYDSNIPNPSQAYDANSSNVNSSYSTNPPAASHPFERNPQNPSRSYDPNVPNSNAPYDANLINTNRTYDPSLSNSQPFDSNVPNGPYDPNLSTSNRPYDPSITNANQPYDPNLPNQNRPYDSNGNPPQQYDANIPNANRPFNSNIPNQNQPYNSNVVNTNQPYNCNAPNMPPYNPKGAAPNTQYDPNLSNSSSSYESNTSHPNQPYDPTLPSPSKNFNEPSTTNPLTPYDKNIPARPCDAPNNTANGVLPCAGYPGGIQAQAPSVPPGPYGTNNYNQPYPGYPATNTDAPPIINDVKPPIPMGSTPSWPVSSTNENSAKPTGLIDNIKTEIKEEPDADIKIADLDTKNVFNDVKSEIKTEIKSEVKGEPENVKVEKSKKENTESPKNNLENDGKKTEEVKNTPEKPESVKTDEKTSSKKNKKPKEKVKDKKHGKKSKEKSKEDEESGKESEEEKKEEEKPEIKEEVPYEWANDLLKNFVPGIIENSAKMELLFCILEESVKIGDRILLFSQSLFTLNLIEDYLQKNFIYGTEVYWCRNRSYYRLDGSTTALEREKLINEFNSNPNVHLFLVSTRAGSLGINLVGANRVVVFDASWNPCHDTQAVCRVYRYGQQKPCFVYRFVMDNCLEKKIYDRQINKQGMSDRVVDECNPDAVLSMKEVTNLCWDEEKDPDSKEVDPACVDKYSDNVVKIIISEHIKTLSKEPFQHESLLVDRKEKKLSSAEKRLAQRGYELEKKAAANPKPTMMYRTIRTADGTIIQRPVASVRPMQHGGSGARWIPAEVWQRQGMTAQEMTLPLDVVIPTNSAEKTNIVLKAGQRVMVLKSPKGIYMQLESGKIIAIKTSFKVGQKPGENTNKDASAIKKGLPVRPSNVNLPGSLKNNSAITVMKSGRGGMQKVITRPNVPNKPSIRPILPMTRIQDMKVRPMNPTMSVRGRPPLTRPTRPIPIQNSLNIKVQGNQSLLNVDKEKVAVEKDKSIVEKEKPKEDVVQSSTESPLPSTITAPLDSKEIKIPKDCTVKIAPKKIECDDVFEESTSQSKILEPSTLPEDVISEDSSQEKTYVDLSDKTESKITTKPSSKKVATPVKQTPAVMKDCKIPIKNSFLPNETVPLTFLNQVTIKRTTVTPTTSAVPLPAATSTHVNTFKAGPVNLAADEILPSEATLTEHKLPTISTQPPQSVLADDNSMEEEEMKEKKIYKPNLVDRKTKINSLKNYRHHKSLQKPIPIQSDLSVSKMSPLSSSSTPTPPPPTKTPDKFESSLSRLEKTATSITRMTKPGGMSDFQQSLNDITRTYSPESEQVYKPGPKSRKKKMQSPMEESSEAAEVTNSAAHIPVDPSVGKTPSATPGYGDAHYPQPLPGPPLEHFGYSGYPPSAGSYPPPAGTYPPAPAPYPPVPGPPYYQGYPPAPGPIPYPPYHPPQSYPPVPYPPAALPYSNPNPNPNPPQW